jgi:hypothetical protein
MGNLAGLTALGGGKLTDNETFSGYHATRQLQWQEVRLGIWIVIVQ